ncbi:flagellar basal body L-ring protein FlgH [Desulfogranum mediterraneum]|uniref:flagellar basal body L-ring protein FlgH n=1 Tax=Desulfogranum mediterraneum TaxID=160661 RepID=UPI000A032152|nr:flagellar basal body L-ring protein FlgH [Desulfogranum mediterraneum]
MHHRLARLIRLARLVRLSHPFQPLATPCRSLVIPMLLLALVAQAGCSKPDQKVVEIPEPLEKPMVATPRPQSPGTLWTGDEGNWLADIKARNVGDIVTVIIQEKASASKEATTESDRDTSMTAGIPKLFGYEKVFEANNPNLDMASLVSANFSNEFKGSGKTTRSEDLVATLTTQVIEVYPNGNMKIRGGKSVMVNNESQIIYLTGIVRGYDITAANTVDSGNILNAQIAYTGKGAISDKQKPGWLMRILDNAWPF